jgi:hypothetical protein
MPMTNLKLRRFLDLWLILVLATALTVKGKHNRTASSTRTASSLSMSQSPSRNRFSSSQTHGSASVTASLTVTPPPTWTASMSQSEESSLSKTRSITPAPRATLTSSSSFSPTRSYTEELSASVTLSRTISPPPTSTVTETRTPPPTPSSTGTKTDVSWSGSFTEEWSSSTTSSRTLTLPPTPSATRTVSTSGTTTLTSSYTPTAPPTVTGSSTTTMSLTESERPFFPRCGPEIRAGPGCAPAPIPDRWDSTSFVIDEKVLRVQSVKISFNASNSVNWCLFSSRAGDQLPAAWFGVRMQVRPDGGLPAANGIGSFNASVYSLTRATRTLFYLNISMLPTLSAEEDEVVEVFLTPSYFSDCPPPVAGVVLGRFLVTANPSALTEATAAVVQAANFAATGTGVLSTTAALDAQSLAVLASMSCSRPNERNMMRSIRLLSPLALFNGYDGMLAGNYILISSMAILQFLACAICRWKFAPSWAEARALVRFPNLLFMVLVLSFQGICSSGLRLILTADNLPSFVFGIASFSIFLIGLPMAIFASSYFYVTADFCVYDFDTLKGGRFRGWKRHLFPVGQWQPPTMSAQFGSTFAASRRTGVGWSMLSLWSPLAMILGSTIRPDTPLGCEVLFGALSAIQLAIFIVLAVFRPLRSNIQLGLGMLSTLTMTAILVCSAIAVQLPGSSVQTASLVLVQVQSVVTILRVMCSVAQSIAERKLNEKPTIVVGSRLGKLEERRRIRRSTQEAARRDSHELLVLPTDEIAYERSGGYLDGGGELSELEGSLLDQSRQRIPRGEFGPQFEFALTGDCSIEEQENQWERRVRFYDSVIASLKQ